MMSPTAKPSAYRPDIDGLRAVAVLLVVLYHARISFRGGFVGVDVFFVISGYLITGLMLRDLELGRFSLADFWERRVRRIFPALAVMSCVTLAAGSPRLSPAWTGALAWTALAVLLITGWVYSRKTLFPGIAALPPCLATAVLIWAGGLESGGGAVSRLLASRGLVKIGLLSYSFYLWHWPVVAFMNYLNAGASDFPGKAGRTLLMAVVLGLSWCSWRWVETPVRQGRVLKSRRSLFAAALTVSVLLLAAGAGLVIKQGFPGSQDLQVLRYASAGVEDRARRAWQDDPEDAFRDTLPVLGLKNPSRPPRVLLWGDSHAMTLAPVVSSWCEEIGESGLLAAHSATVPMFGYYRKSRSGLDSRGPAWAEAVFELIRKHRIPEIMLTAYWKESAGKDPDSFALALLKTVQRLSGAGARVWLVLDVPELAFDVPRALAFHAKLPWLVSDPRRLATTRETHAENNRLLLRLVPELTKAGARVLDPSTLLFNQEGRCRIEQDGVPLYGDSHHLTISGTLLLRPLFKPVFLP